MVGGVKFSSIKPLFIPKAPGVYILLLFLPGDRVIEVGSRGRFAFKAGFYAYLGSAMGGLNRRLRRYYHPLKNKRWHIDYLLEEAVLEDAFGLETAQRMECSVSAFLSRHFSAPAAGFGSSDCSCSAHLYYSAMKADLTKAIKEYPAVPGNPGTSRV